MPRQVSITTSGPGWRHPLARIDYPNGEWMPRMFDVALAIMGDDAAGAKMTLKAVAASHGYRAEPVSQTVPDGLRCAPPSAVLVRIDPPEDAPVAGMLCGRTVEGAEILNWFVEPVEPVEGHIGTVLSSSELERLRDEIHGGTFEPGRVLILSAGEPFPGQREDNGWSIKTADWRDEHVAIHGPNGLIASGLTMDQARALVDAHGAASVGTAQAGSAK